MRRYKELTGRRFGKLIALYRVEVGEKGYAKWFCQCDCGGSIVVDSKRLQRGTVTNCGCVAKRTGACGPYAEDLQGKRFGRLIVLERAENLHHRVRWRCVCDCGREVVVYARDLKEGRDSCGCTRKKVYRDITGQRFGRLVALESTTERNKKGSVMWRCRCDCGNVCLVSEDGLVHGGTASCGCRQEEARETIYRHAGLLDGTSYAMLRYRTSPRADSQSGIRGVRKTDGGRYRASIGFKGKQYYLGTFATVEEAIFVRKEAEVTLHRGFCDAYERWKRLGCGSVNWERAHPLIYDVSFQDRQFGVRCNIDELEERYTKIIHI